MEENSDEDENLKNRLSLIGELNKRKEKLKSADDWIMDYIKKWSGLNYIENKNFGIMSIPL